MRSCQPLRIQCFEVGGLEAADTEPPDSGNQVDPAQLPVPNPGEGRRVGLTVVSQLSSHAATVSRLAGTVSPVMTSAK
ncbi:MAG: hypothetical protein ACYDC5_11430 [Candidatus Dormibacteria bacterium]